MWELSTSRCLIAYTGAGTTGKQENMAQAVFNHTEDYVMFPDEATTSLCAWDSRNASRKQLLSASPQWPTTRQRTTCTRRHEQSRHPSRS